MGVSGSGKSTVGALLADTLKCPFLEGDHFHAPAAIAKMRGGAPLTDNDRWPWLDRVGSAARDAVEEHGLVVVACSALRRSYRDRLRSAVSAPTRFILLDNHRDEICDRLQSRSHFMPAALLDSQLATLERPTADEPATILISNVSPAQLCERIVDWLGSQVPTN